MVDDDRLGREDAPGQVGMVQARDLEVRIGSDILLPAVTFEVFPGSTLAVTGPNGSGKTTLLRVLAGLTSPSAGDVTVGGLIPNERAAVFRKAVAALLGVPALARNLTLAEHLQLVATSWGMEIDRAGERALQQLSDFGIERLAQRFPHELSSGQTQLFSLALTLVRPCDVLLLDEPEQRLDAERLGLVAGGLERLRNEGATIILASHSAWLVDRLAPERLAVGEAGTMVGAPHDSRH